VGQVLRIRERAERDRIAPRGRRAVRRAREGREDGRREHQCACAGLEQPPPGPPVSAGEFAGPVHALRVGTTCGRDHPSNWLRAEILASSREAIGRASSAQIVAD